MEREIITWLKSIFPGQPPLLVGIGDDAAVLEIGFSRLVVTTDAIVDGVHFETADHSWQRIGHKSVAVNLSDLAAMGATPRGIVDTMRRRVIELDRGSIVRDQSRGVYE